ncbi:MAG TPA: phosphotransferase, partial [Chroococcales cyanobacterium]
SVSNSAQLYLTGQYGRLTALFLEDLGSASLLANPTAERAQRLGEELAKMHRSYCYRTDELMQTGVLRTLFPLDYEEFTAGMVKRIAEWKLAGQSTLADVEQLAALLARKLASEPISLVHGDLYAENIILRNHKTFIIDWSWFTMLGVPLMDLATICMEHPKNGDLYKYRDDLLEVYCFESGRDRAVINELLPYAETLARLIFLQWLVERRNRGIMGTTVGPVDNLIPRVITELQERLANLV